MMSGLIISSLKENKAFGSPFHRGRDSEYAHSLNFIIIKAFGSTTLEFANLIVTILGIAYFSVIEGLQVYFKGWSYFRGIWNFIDLSSIVLNIFLIVNKYTEMVASENTVVLAFIAVILMWANFIFWIRIFESKIFYFNLISQTVIDMLDFFAIFILIIFACGNAIFVLNANRVQSDDGDALYATSFTEGFGSGYLDAILNQLIVSVG